MSHDLLVQVPYLNTKPKAMSAERGQIVDDVSVSLRSAAVRHRALGRIVRAKMCLSPLK